MKVHAPALDVDRIRREFPALDQRVDGKPLVYLDSAATTQKPRCVIDAVTRFYERDNANIHRGLYDLSRRATNAYETARETVGSFLGAAAASEIVFVRGATEAINLVARSFARPRLEPGDEILVTHLEHHANIVPWQIVARESGANLRVAPVDDTGTVDLAAFEALLGPRTRLAAINHVSNALGTVSPVSEMTAMARDRGIPVLVDGAQAVARMPVDVEEIGCDFYVLSGHKLYGPTGIGALWGRGEVLATMEPYQGGGDMIRSVTFEETTFADPPQRFEAGTPNIAGAIGLGAAIDWVRGIGLEAIGAHEDELLHAATARLLEIPGIRIVGTAASKAGVVSFVHEEIHPHDFGTVLDSSGVAIRAGHHCAQPVMERFGVPATVRASFGVYNTLAEIDALADAIREVREIFGR